MVVTQNGEKYACGFSTRSFCSGERMLWDGRLSSGETSADEFEVALLQDHQYMPRRGGVRPTPS